jgi:hypothetical protein
MSQDVARSGLSLAEELHLVEEAGSLSIKGYNYSNIAELMDITPYKAKQYVQEYFRLRVTHIFLSGYSRIPSGS